MARAPGNHRLIVVTETPDAYIGREQTLVKHAVLRTHLSRFAPIVLSYWDSIVYVDCFSGPWNAHTNDLSDTSFAVALDELRKAKDVQQSKGRAIELRCFFLEKDKYAYAKLKAFAESVPDVSIETRNGTLEESVSAIVDFVHKAGTKTFPFIFIDPTGWTGFAMDTIAPLLRLEPCEVLINLMTKDIRRFIESPEDQTQASFDRLFGRTGIREGVAGRQGLDRDDYVVDEYRASVAETGHYDYVCATVVLHPERDRTHFHLVYATRLAAESKPSRTRRRTRWLRKSPPAPMRTIDDAKRQPVCPASSPNTRHLTPATTRICVSTTSRIRARSFAGCSSKDGECRTKRSGTSRWRNR